MVRKSTIPVLIMLLISCSQKKEETKIDKIITIGDEKIAVILDFSEETPSSARFFAIGHRFVLTRDVENEKAYYNSYRKYMEIIKPYLNSKSIVVFEEHAGLPLLFFGSRGKEARENARNTLVAASILMSKYSEAISYYVNKFPQISTMIARQLFLALTDTTYRVFYNTFSSLAKEYGVFVVSCQNTSYPYIEKKTGDTTKFVDEAIEDKTFYFEATTSDVWNTCFIFSPSGEIVHKTRKVNLVPAEKDELQLSPGKYEELEVYRIPGTEIDVCIAISLDAFIPEYIRILDEKGCDVLLQPDANSRGWAGPGGLGKWQPEEWLGSTLGSIQTEYSIGCTNRHIALYQGKCEFQKIPITWKKSIRYNVNPMMTGNLFEVPFDGQTAITGRDKRAKRNINYIGNVPLDEMKTDGELSFKEGGFIILGPWTFEIDSSLPLEEQRKSAVEFQKSLSQGGENENAYISTVIGTSIPSQ